MLSNHMKNHALVFEDACECLQVGFEASEHHCLNTYGSGLGWVLKRCLIQQ